MPAGSRSIRNSHTRSLHSDAGRGDDSGYQRQPDALWDSSIPTGRRLSVSLTPAGWRSAFTLKKWGNERRDQPAAGLRRYPATSNVEQILEDVALDVRNDGGIGKYVSNCRCPDRVLETPGDVRFIDIVSLLMLRFAAVAKSMFGLQRTAGCALMKCSHCPIDTPIAMADPFFALVVRVNDFF